MKKLKYSPEALSKLKSIRAEITGNYGKDLVDKIMNRMLKKVLNVMDK